MDLQTIQPSIGNNAPAILRIRLGADVDRVSIPISRDFREAGGCNPPTHHSASRLAGSSLRVLNLEPGFSRARALAAPRVPLSTCGLGPVPCGEPDQ